MKSAFLFALCILGVSAAVGQSPTAEKIVPVSAVQEEDRYRIGFHDIIDITVFNHPNLNQRVAVGASGTIALFRLENPVAAVCKTERELANEIVNAYKEKYLKNPQVNVMVADQRSQSFAVMGAVEKPGNFYVSRKIHLLELLALAGGPNKESGTRMLVARAGSTSHCKANAEADDDDSVAVMDFKIRDVQEGRQTLWMRAGDVVSVLDTDVVYMYGNIEKPGALKMREPITLTQAIASAEGLKPATKKDKIRVLRQEPGKTDRTELIFNLDNIDKGKMKDPFLEPNDIVAISEDKTKAILRGITRALKTSVPSVIYRAPGF